MPAHENLHPGQFHDWWGGSDEAIAHILKKRDANPTSTAHLDWRAYHGFTDPPDDADGVA